MTSGDLLDARPSSTDIQAPRHDGTRRWVMTAVGWSLAAIVLFLGYVRMSRDQPANSDGASNALQAWDMLHGNILLLHWTVTDVSFYATELVQYALVEWVYGLNSDVIHISAAMTYTLIVLLVAALARGRVAGARGWMRMAVAVAVVVAPAPGYGSLTLLGSPDHTGTAVPVLLAWLVVDRMADNGMPPGRWSDRLHGWLVPALLAALLAWGQISDPLMLFVGALPLAVVCGWRLIRDGWPGRRHLIGSPHTRMLLAALASVVLARGVITLIRLVGGWTAHPPTTKFAPIGRLDDHVSILARGLAIDFGGYLPDLNHPAALTFGVLHLIALAACLAALVVAIVRAARRGANDLASQLVAAGILVNVGAFLISTLPVDLLSARQVVLVLPLGAVLAGRMFGDRLAMTRPALGRIPVAAALLVLLAGCTAQAVTADRVPPAHQDVASWLTDGGYRYGLGHYWTANILTLTTGGRVRVAPLTGTGPIRAYNWETRDDWYDPARHDARFLVLDRGFNGDAVVAAAVTQFGKPVLRKDFDTTTVLIYDHNLLIGLPAMCIPDPAPSMADCPR